MKTSVIKIDDMLSVWSLDEVESQIGAVPGVESVTVNFAAESATVRYDETRVAVSDIKSTVHELGLQSTKPTEDAPSEGAAAEDHENPGDESEPAAALESDTQELEADRPAAKHDAHAGHERHDDPASNASKHSADRHTDTTEPSSEHADHADHDSHDKHQGHTPEKFRNRFWLSLAVTVPVVIWSTPIQDLLGYQAPAFPGSDWMAPVLSTAVFLYGGLVFLKGAWQELRDRLPGMMTLISLAITVAFVFSWVVQLGLIDSNPLWWELASLVTIMLLGHWIEMRSINQAQGALKELAKLLPDTATRITDTGEETVDISALRNGARVKAFPRMAWCARAPATLTRQ